MQAFRHNIIAVTILFFSLFAHSQEITGRILDSQTNEPIPFVTIQYGTNEGVISNMEGYFTFFNKNLNSSNILNISAMGYQGLQISVKQLEEKNNTIRLSEALNMLSTVYVSNKRPNADTIMQRVNRNLEKNYAGILNKYTFFTRESSFFKPSIITIEIDKSSGFNKKQLQESNAQLKALEANVLNRPPAQLYIDILSNLYVGNGEDEKIKVIKATKLLDANNKVSFESIQEKATAIILKHLDASKTYKLKSGLFTLEDEMSINFDEEKEDKKNERKIDYSNVKNELARTISSSLFNSETEFDFIVEPKNYEYELVEITSFNDQLVYILSFTPDKRKAKFSGKIYVAEEDYAVLKTEYKYAEGKTGEKVNLKLLLGLKFAENVKSGTLIFSKNLETNTYFPKYVNQQIGQYIYVHRPLKFIENSKSNKDKVAFDFKIEGHIMQTTELFNIETSALTHIEYNQLKENNTEEYQLLTQYDPEIWKNINTLEPLEEMKQFKVGNSELKN